MSAQKILILDPSTGLVKEYVPVDTSSGASDKGKLIALDASGHLDETLLPTGIGADTASIKASEAISSGDFVNVYDDSGTAKIRKANATDATKPAHGFVKDGVSANSNGTVYFRGGNTKMTGLSVGDTYCLSASTGGGVEKITNAPSSTGNTLQVLGEAISTTELEVSITQPVVRV